MRQTERERESRDRETDGGKEREKDLKTNSNKQRVLNNDITETKNYKNFFSKSFLLLILGRGPKIENINVEK